MLKTKTEPECHLSATPSMNPYSNNLSPLPSYCPFTLGWFSHSVSHCLIWIYSSRCSFLSRAKVRHLPKLNISLNFCWTLLHYSQMLPSLPMYFSWWLCTYTALALPCSFASSCCSVAKPCSVLCNSTD